MKSNNWKRYLLVLPALLLLLFSFYAIGDNEGGKVLCFESYYPYVSQDIFGEYIYLSVEMPVNADFAINNNIPSPNNGTFYIAFDASVNGLPSTIQAVSLDPKPGFVQASLYENKESNHWVVQAYFDRIRVIVPQLEQRPALKPDGTEDKVRVYIRQNGQRFDLVDIQPLDQ